MVKMAFLSGLFFLMLLGNVNVYAEKSVHDTAGDLLGNVSATKLLGVETFLRGYEKTNISKQELEIFGAIEGDVRLQVLFGTWCHDSQREVPQIVRLAEMASNPNVSVSLIAVSRDKLEPVDAVARYQLKYTPTIIVFKDGKELGRIIEKPVQNWASDIAEILAKN